MTPKEKAKELIIMFSEYTLKNEVTGIIDWDSAQQCALICVDKMIKEHELISENYKWQDERWKWLQEVKQEIEKL